MKLIRKLGMRLNKNGTKVYWGEFLCPNPECNKIVEMPLSAGKICKSCGCLQHSEEVTDKISKTQKENLSNPKKHPMYGKKHTENTRKKQSESKKDLYFGQNNPNWNNGSSFEPYAPEFNKPLKQQVLERDNYKCQDSNCEHKSIKLHIHHIDYDKQNNAIENLITLCIRCHTKTNGKNKRHYYIKYYQNIISKN